MSELTCPECGNDVPVGEFPVEEWTRVRCGNCKRPLWVSVDSSAEWEAPNGERFGTAALVLDEDDEDEDEGETENNAHV